MGWNSAFLTKMPGEASAHRPHFIKQSAGP